MSDPGLNILSDGTYQDERHQAALEDGYFRPDEKTVSDQWVYWFQLARIYNYYSLRNEPDGNWLPFLESDVNINLAVISKFSIRNLVRHFDRTIQNVSYSADIDEALSETEKLFTLFKEMTGIVSRWQKRFNTSHKNSDFTDEINLSVTQMGEDLQNLEAAAQVLNKRFGKDFSVLHESFPSAVADTIKAAISVKGFNPVEGSDFDLILKSTARFNESFDALQKAFIHLSYTASRILNDISLSAHPYRPHTALLYTFLNLYKQPQRLINDFTGRHLDFYYEDILQLKPRAMIPDQVHVFFGLVPNVSELVIKQGAQLEVEKVGNEEATYYNIDEEILATSAEVADIKTITISKETLVSPDNPDEEPLYGNQVYKGGMTNPDPAKISTAPHTSWPVMGEAPVGNQIGDPDYFADLGLVVASPLLYLPEGDRSVHVRLYIESQSFENFMAYVENFAKLAAGYKITAADFSQELLSKTFTPQYTSKTGWASIEEYSVSCYFDQSGQNANYLNIHFNLHANQPGFDIYKPALHGGQYHTEWPLLQLLINNYSPYYPYSYLKGLAIEKVEIKSEVYGFKNLKLQNSIGAVSPVNPFQVFGPAPAIGSFLNIGNTNVFNKFNDWLEIDIEWLDLPGENGGFDDYYSAYNAGLHNSSFKFLLSTMKNGKYEPDKKDQQLFNLFQVEKTETGDYLLRETLITDIEILKLEFQNDPLLAADDATPIYELKDGLVRIELAAPKEGFGHKLYPQILPEVLIHNSKKRRKLPLPNPPFTPEIKSISVNYRLTVSETIKKNAQRHDNENNVQLLHIQPFGALEVYPQAPEPGLPAVIPEFDGFSNLHVGIKSVLPGQVLNLLFQLEESNFTNMSYDIQEVKWSYLAGNRWKSFGAQDILSDGTNNFINTGIIKIQAPETIDTENTLMPGGLFWIKAWTPDLCMVNSRMTGIFSNSVRATRALNAATENESLKLAPGKIAGFKLKTPGIATVWQPFSSFGGRPSESYKAFITRVSERLKHKQRPLAAIDFEKMALDRFPEIQLAKCIGANAHDKLLANNDIRLVVIPKYSHSDGENIPKVNLATLMAIKTYLSVYLSPFVNLEVGNPRYEKVKVICSVRFRKDGVTRQGNYLKQLNQDIKSFICPWFYGTDNEIKIGARIFKSDIINKIKKLPYVDMITGFSMVHFYEKPPERIYETLYGINDTAAADADVIYGSSPESILISVDDHMITVLDTPLYADPKMSGIGTLAVGNEFIVSNYHSHTHAAQTKTETVKEDEELLNLLIRTYPK